MKKFISLSIIMTTFIACDITTPNTPMETYKKQSQDQQQIIKTQDRIKIKQIGIFRDSLAYSEMRGIYIISDNETGKEFIGISGIGISEVGSHTNGRATISDEE